MRNTAFVSACALFCVLRPHPGDAAPGEVLKTLPAPGYYTTGLAFDGTDLWAANLADASHPDELWYAFFRVSIASGLVVQTIPMKGYTFHGLAWDGAALWGDEKYTKLRKVSASTGLVLETLTLPSDGLAYGLAIDVAGGMFFVSHNDNATITRLAYPSWKPLVTVTSGAGS